MNRTLLLILAAASLAGCAAGGPSQRLSELDAMTRECSERGGILMPIPGAHHGNERANYSCEIRGGGTRTR